MGRSPRAKVLKFTVSESDYRKWKKTFPETDEYEVVFETFGKTRMVVKTGSNISMSQVSRWQSCCSSLLLVEFPLSWDKNVIQGKLFYQQKRRGKKKGDGDVLAEMIEVNSRKIEQNCESIPLLEDGEGGKGEVLSLTRVESEISSLSIRIQNLRKENESNRKENEKNFLGLEKNFEKNFLGIEKNFLDLRNENEKYLLGLWKEVQELKEIFMAGQCKPQACWTYQGMILTKGEE